MSGISLDYTDHIVIFVKINNSKTREWLYNWAEFMAKEVLCDLFVLVDELPKGPKPFRVKEHGYDIEGCIIPTKFFGV
jgi:hypothetical protein